MIIEGKQRAREIIEMLKKRPAPKGIFAVILVGNDPSSVSFIKQKEKVAKEFGVDFRLYTFPDSSTNDALRHAVGELAQKKSVASILIQLPLPEKINRHYVLNVVPREKDVDVLGERALGAFYVGRNRVFPTAVATLKKIIENEKIDISKMSVAVLGAGLLVGSPISIWLKDKVKELTVFTENSGDVTSKLNNFDLIISGVGKGYLFNSSQLKKDAIVIDFGYDVLNGKLVGDFDPNNAPESLKYTPTPGGTGPILVASLFENFFTLTEER